MLSNESVVVAKDCTVRKSTITKIWIEEFDGKEVSHRPKVDNSSSDKSNTVAVEDNNITTSVYDNTTAGTIVPKL